MGGVFGPDYTTAVQDYMVEGPANITQVLECRDSLPVDLGPSEGETPRNYQETTKVWHWSVESKQYSD